MDNVSETPTPTTCLKSNTFNLYGSTPPICVADFPGFLRRKGNPSSTPPPICIAVRLPFLRQYAPPFVRQYFLEKCWGWGHRNVSEKKAVFVSQVRYREFTHKGFDQEIAWKMAQPSHARNPSRAAPSKK